MIQMEGPRRQLSTGGTLASTGTAIACIYRTDGDPIAGDYSRGAQLNQTQATSLATALSGPGQPGTCPPQSQFAVIHLGHRLAYVELGGCWRVLRPDDTLGRADITTVLRILNP
jgi:hypothetical protein